MADSLSYSSAETPWYQWEPENVILNSLLFSALITVISFEILAIVRDLILSFRKRRAYAKANKFGIMVLAWKPSPLGLLHNLLRLDWLSRAYYGRNIPQKVSIPRHGGRTKMRTVSTLFVLLFSPPIVDMFMIVLGLESRRPLTFEDAGFHPIGFGFEGGLPVKDRYSDYCDAARIRKRSSDTVIPRLLTCSRVPFTSINRNNSRLVQLGVFVSNVTIMVAASFSDQLYYANTRGYLRYANTTYAVKTSVSHESAASVVGEAARAMTVHCGVVEEVFAYENNLPEPTLLAPMSQRGFRCENGYSLPGETKRNLAKAGFDTFMKHLTFVPAEEFHIAVKNRTTHRMDYGPNTFDASGLLFIRRRGKNGSFGVLAIVTVSLVLMRTVVAWLAPNDLFEGIESLIKHQLGYASSCALLLEPNEDISFRNEFPSGETAHYRLFRKGNAEVEEYPEEPHSIS